MLGARPGRPLTSSPYTHAASTSDGTTLTSPKYRPILWPVPSVRSDGTTLAMLSPSGIRRREDYVQPYDALPVTGDIARGLLRGVK
jgi:hypothetical protein